MSLAEMKAVAIEKLNRLEDEAAVREVMQQLDKLAASGTQHLNLSQHYDVIAEQYGDTLQRLAQ